jgi:uncharacterized protein YbaR (Trm112 family)
MTESNLTSILDLLCCPDCKAALSHLEPKALICSGCSRTFPVIEGIPDLRPQLPQKETPTSGKTEA